MNKLKLVIGQQFFANQLSLPARIWVGKRTELIRESFWYNDLGRSSLDHMKNTMTMATLEKGVWMEDVCNITRLVILALTTGHGYWSLLWQLVILLLLLLLFSPFLTPSYTILWFWEAVAVWHGGQHRISCPHPDTEHKVTHLQYVQWDLQVACYCSEWPHMQGDSCFQNPLECC